MRAFLCTTLLLILPLMALAKGRHSLDSAIKAKDAATGRQVRFTKGFTFDIVSGGDKNARLRFYDPNGMEVQGEFEVPARLIRDALKKDLEESLKAAKSGGEIQQPGCCAVANPSDHLPLGAARLEKDPVRSPAIAPGTSIVYADPLPSRAPVPTPRPEPTRKEELKADLRHIPVPTPRPDYTPKASTRSQAGLRLPDRVPIPLPRPDYKPEVTAQEASPRPEPRSPASGDLCRAFREFLDQGVPDAPLRQAMFYLSQARKEGKVAPNARYFAVGDFSQRSDRKRFYLLDLETLSVTTERVSHGGGVGKRGNKGDPEHDGMVNRCSRGSGDGMQRVGFFRVGEHYFSTKHKYSWPRVSEKPRYNGLRMDGLMPGINSDARNDGVVMHEARYNPTSGVMGRSHSCPAFSPGRGKPLMQKLSGGSLYYSYVPACKNDMQMVVNRINGWQSFCR